VLKDHRVIAEILNGPAVTAESIVTTIAAEGVVDEDVVVLASATQEAAS
jgi:monosaccharide-transporting ATPase